jgi:DNA-binding NarL/FixJ family response regulator
MISERISVVIVESQPMMRNALSTALSADGMMVLAEFSGSMQALHSVPQLEPDVVLLAVGTPGWVDLEVIVALRKLMPASAIVALVTGEIPGQEQIALKQGAHLVLTKSIPRSELLNAIKRISTRKFHSASVQVT